MTAAKPLVYVETSIVSYLAARPSREPGTSARQRLTHEWWSAAPARYALAASVLVVQEVSAGDPVVAAARNAFLSGVRILTVSPAAVALATYLLREGLLPAKAAADAGHVAVAAVEGADYLVTWNMRHLAGPVVSRRIEHALRARGYTPPMLCTPEDLRNPPS